MQIAAVGTKTRQNILIFVPVIATSAGSTLLPKMSHIKFPCVLHRLGVWQHTISNEACSLEMAIT